MNENGVGTKIYRMNEISDMLCDRNISKYAELSDNQIETYKLKDTKVWTIFQNSSCLVKRQGHILLNTGANILRVCIFSGTRRKSELPDLCL